MKRGRAGVLFAVAAGGCYIALEHALSTGAVAPFPARFDFGWVLLLVALAPLFAILWLQASRARSAWRYGVVLVIAATAWLGWRLPILAHMDWYYWLQGVAINAAFALFFGRSLLPDTEPVCARFARAIYDELAPPLARYTRRATWAWTIFFIANIAISSLLFAGAGRATWSLFANVLYLPLVLLMFAGEYLVRRLALPRDLCGHWLDAMRGFHNYQHRSRQQGAAGNAARAVPETQS